LNLRQIYDQAYFAYLYFWGGKQSGFINYGYWNDDTIRPSDAHFLLFQKLFKLISPPTSILDLGCGFGGASFQFLQKTKAQVTGLTHSQKQIETCEQRCSNFKNQVQFINSDYHKFLDSTEQNFDLIWAVESIYHEKDKKAFLQKLKNQLAPGGQILIVDYYLSSDTEDSTFLKTWFEGYKIGEIITSETFERYAQELGLKIVQNLDWSSHVLEGSKRIKNLGMLSFPLLWPPHKLGLVSKSFINGTKASIAQYHLLKTNMWKYKVYVLEQDNFISDKEN